MKNQLFKLLFMAVLVVTLVIAALKLNEKKLHLGEEEESKTYTIEIVYSNGDKDTLIEKSKRKPIFRSEGYIVFFPEGGSIFNEVVLANEVRTCKIK